MAKGTDPVTSFKLQALQTMHQLLLEALRNREQEIIQFLALLGSSLLGFVWLLKLRFEETTSLNVRGVLESKAGLSDGAFVVGVLCILLLLLLGAVYALALGYNYRSLTLQLAKLETALGIKTIMLKRWPKSPRRFLRDNRLRMRHISWLMLRILSRRWRVVWRTYIRIRHIPWCTPPEIIKYFWVAFLVGIAGVSLSTCLLAMEPLVLLFVVPSGLLALIFGLVMPITYGYYLHESAKHEIGGWGPGSLR